MAPIQLDSHQLVETDPLVMTQSIPEPAKKDFKGPIDQEYREEGNCPRIATVELSLRRIPDYKTPYRKCSSCREFSNIWEDIGSQTKALNVFASLATIIEPTMKFNPLIACSTHVARRTSLQFGQHSRFRRPQRLVNKRRDLNIKTLTEQLTSGAIQIYEFFDVAVEFFEPDQLDRTADVLARPAPENDDLEGLAGIVAEEPAPVHRQPVRRHRLSAENVDERFGAVGAQVESSLKIQMRVTSHYVDPEAAHASCKFREEPLRSLLMQSFRLQDLEVDHVALRLRLPLLLGLSSP
ncbi:hypothetical protein OUZ56_016970 [Daphnia magna]|uniref:Uncharacterized protein n=1 Tax=Daphnia magna TaxID=35525 RepID=A0ABR0ARU5_9CRUS|nr:hypothetical protein OUZ56_016970 [Daphnia magna]